MYLLAVVRLDENRLRYDFTGIHLLRFFVDELVAFGESSLENVVNKQNKNTHCLHSVATSEKVEVTWGLHLYRGTDDAGTNCCIVTTYHSDRV